MDRDRDAPEFSVDLPCHLTWQLDALTEALDGAGDDLTTILRVLADDVTAAVASFAGLSVTVAIDGQPVTVTAMHPDVTAVTSMLLPLTPAFGTAPGSYLVFYAEKPGAFVDLAADTRVMFGLDGQVVLDGDLPAPTRQTGDVDADRLGQRSTMNQALGFLIEQGCPPGNARAELNARATAAGASVHQMAERIVCSGDV